MPLPSGLKPDLNMKYLFSFLFLLCSLLSFSQKKVKDTLSRRATINYSQNGNTVLYKAQTPPLIPIAGAPKPSFSYLWEFGDGAFSKEAQPKHTYRNKGTYNTRLTVTNNYDNGKPPATRPKKVVVNDISDKNFDEIASIANQNGFALQKNCDPIPEQEMEVILSYQNLENYVTNGKIYLFYNEKQFKDNNFELSDFRTYAGERTVTENSFASINDTDQSHSYLASNENYTTINKLENNFTEEDLDAALADAHNIFKNVSILEFDDANPQETHNVFYTFKTTPEMLKDTSATITMRGIYVPNRSFKNHKVKNLEMEIVTSHDPNKMGSNGSFMNYRFVRFKRVNFKTRFQNNGEGPARMIRLETDIPDMFDKKTFKIEGMYPECPICPKDEIPTTSCLDTIIKQKQIIFTFKNIYLPGSEQKNVKEKDSTKGFVKYSMKFNKDFHKVNTRSRTSIIFDKNTPIITNYATTRFLPGISIGAKAGYNFYPNLDKSTSYFVGATISPYKSYRFYWQAELINNKNNYSTAATITNSIATSANGVRQAVRTTSMLSYSNFNNEIPLLIRYNINNYVGIGAGVQANINASQKEESYTKIETFETEKPDSPIIDTQENTISSSKTFTDFKSGVLFDLTLGFARIGPSLGARYVMNFKENFNYVQLYGIWRF
jgi:hypothetical protein